jgi:Legionella pneumophila major outer membrane protein precursor
LGFGFGGLHMRRPLLLGLCGVVLATGLGAVIALAGDNGDANSDNSILPVTDGHHRLFLVRVPEGQAHIQVVPLDGPSLPEVPNAASAAPVPDAPSAVTPPPPPDAPSAFQEPSGMNAPPVDVAPSAPKPLTRLPEFAPSAKVAGPAMTSAPEPRPAAPVWPAQSQAAEPPPPPDPPVSLGMPAMDRIVETALQQEPPSAPKTAPVPPRRVEASPRELLHQARELYQRNKLTESEALARHVAAMLVRWNPDEDSPSKLLADIEKTRQAALKPAAPPQPRFPIIAGVAARLHPKSDEQASVQPVAPVPPPAIPSRGPVVQASAFEPHLVPMPAEPPPTITPPVTAFASQPALQSPTPVPPPTPSAPGLAISPPVSPPTGPAPQPMAESLVHPSEGHVLDTCDTWEGHSTYLAADVGFSIVRPYIKDNPAFFVSTAGNPAVARQMELNPATQFLPEISLSLVSPEDWGFRVNWWGFSTSDSELLTNPGRVVTASPLGLGQALISQVPGDQFAAFSKLAMNVTDFEATRDFRGASWAITVAGGFRYAHIAQRYDAVEIDSATNTLLSGQSFNGFGPTLFARGRWQVANTGFYVYGAGRGSLLYGQAEQDAGLLTAGQTVTVDAGTSSRMVMPVAEMEMGMGWRRVWRGTDFFFEVGLDYQVWFEAGNASRSSIEPFPPFVGTILTAGTSSTEDYNLGLMALTFRIGMNY